MVSPIILILGAGLRTGAKVAETFAKNGFKIALATRTTSNYQGNAKDLVIKADFSDSQSIKAIFDEVKAKIGTPNVVLYNAYAAQYNPDTFHFTVEEFAASLAVNTISVYAAAKEAVAGFDTLPAEAIKTFIYTGNNLNHEVLPALLDLGVGKAASAHLIEVWAKTHVEKGYNFYYGDERNADGSAVGGKISGDNHAKFYLELALKKEQGPWDATFVGGKGYVDFTT